MHFNAINRTTEPKEQRRLVTNSANYNRRLEKYFSKSRDYAQSVVGTRARTSSQVILSGSNPDMLVYHGTDDIVPTAKIAHVTSQWILPRTEHKDDHSTNRARYIIHR